MLHDGEYDDDRQPDPVHFQGPLGLKGPSEQLLTETELAQYNTHSHAPSSPEVSPRKAAAMFPAPILSQQSVKLFKYFTADDAKLMTMITETEWISWRDIGENPPSSDG